MRSAGFSNPLVPLIVLALVGWSIYRRTRSQQVRPGRTVAITMLIVLLSLTGLAANARLLAAPLFLVVAPMALVAGLVMGWLMMRMIRFWRDQATGQVWMSGGAAYVAIWLATVLFRLSIDYMATGSFSKTGLERGGQPPTTLAIIASDLLFLSIGLWIARGYALIRRYRELAVPGAEGQ